MPKAPTPAVTALDRAGVPYRLHPYEVEGLPPDYGVAVAAALGVDPARLFKTLVADADGVPVVALVPAAASLAPKALAAAVGARKARLMERGEAERRTGYVAGGISPFGQRQPSRTVVDATALGWSTVFVSAGRRGLQVEVAPQALLEVLDASVADLQA